MIDQGNRFVKELNTFLKDNFVNAPKMMLSSIIIHKDDIIKDNAIDITKLFDEKNVDYFRKYNKVRIENNYLKFHFVENIITILEKIILEDGKAEVLTTETRSKTYKNVIEKDDELIPDDSFDIKSFKMNLFYNNKIEFGFNKNIPIRALDKSFSYIQSLRLSINGSGDQVIIPTKYEVICTERFKGVECGNIVTFCDVHKNNQIKCSDSPSKHNPGHTIKKIEIAPVKESVILYSYDGKDILNDKTEDIRIYSLVEIDKEKIKCNGIYVVENKDEYLLITSIETDESDIKTLDENILLKDDKSRHFLDDIFKSLKKYLLKEHNIIMTNQNKYVGEVIIFILLNKIFYDMRMNAFIVGTSGSGKSFWSNYVIPMFTFNYKIISGNDVTRNRFLGGRSNVISSFKNSVFQIGLVGTQDIIFCEESTEPLNRFFDVNNVNKESNLFSMLKVASSQYDVGIQGSKDIVPKASVIMVGNLEQLNHVQKYKSLVAKKYRHYSGGQNYKNSWPLYKQLEYYKNQELAKAHMYVRKYDWSGHYITKLPEAEYSRLSFFIALEDEDQHFKAPEMERETIFKRFHRKELIDELELIFNKKIPIEFKQEIYNYYVNEYLKKRNNIMKNGMKALNTHILKRQFEIVSQLIFMNKLYYNQEMVLNDMDKAIAEDFMLYNHNCLSNDEASLIKKPFINDYNSVVDEDDLFNYNIQQKEDYVKKQEDDKKAILELIDDKGEDLLEDN